MIEIAKCSSCGVLIQDTHEHSWCTNCGEPLPDNVREHLPKFKALKAAAAETLAPNAPEILNPRDWQAKLTKNVQVLASIVLSLGLFLAVIYPAILRSQAAAPRATSGGYWDEFLENTVIGPERRMNAREQGNRALQTGGQLILVAGAVLLLVRYTTVMDFVAKNIRQPSASVGEAPASSPEQQQAGPSFCTACGQKLTGIGGRYCPACGVAVNEPQSS